MIKPNKPNKKRVREIAKFELWQRDFWRQATLKYTLDKPSKNLVKVEYHTGH